MKLLGCLAILLAVGCVPSLKEYGRDPKPVPPVHNEPEISGDAITEEYRDIVRAALGILPSRMVESLDLVRISGDLPHFRRKYKKDVPIGHLCEATDHAICLRAGYIKRSLVWHETAHVYAKRLDDYYHKMASHYFHRDWLNIAGEVYGDGYEGDPETEGILTTYGRRSVHEDIAEWVEKCYEYLYTAESIPIFHKSHIRKDERYRRKLALLYQYGFFSEADYKKLKPLFQ